MEINGTPVPDEALLALGSLLDEVPDDKVLAFAKAHSEFLAGMRPIRDNAGVLRTRLKHALTRGRQMDEAVALFVADNSLQRHVAAVLSEEAVQMAFRDLAMYFGDARFAAAMLLDPRGDLRQMALDLFRDRQAGAAPTDETARLQAARNLELLFAPFLGHIAGLKGAPPHAVAAPPSEDLRGEVKRLTDKLREAGEKLDHQERRAAREKQKVLGDAEQVRRDKEALEQALLAEKDRARTAAEAARAAERAGAELQAAFDRRVDERLQSELSAQLRAWLEPVRALDDAARTLAAQPGAGMDILARAKAALTRQAEVDRHYGNRVALERRLAELESLRGDLDRARRDALNPLAELAVLASELDREIQHVRGTLAQPAPASAFLAEIQARINAAGTLDDLAAVRQFLDAAADLGVLHGRDLRLLYNRADEQAGRLYDRRPPMQVVSLPVIGPLHVLRQALARDLEFLLLVDGYNVLHLLPEFFEPLYEEGRPAKQARDGLTASLVRVFGRRTHPAARLYFDGPERSDMAASPQVLVVFSGGSGEHRADEVILQDLEFYSRERAGTPRCLVSSDSDLIRQARALKAMTMRPDEFAVLLASVGE